MDRLSSVPVCICATIAVIVRELIVPQALAESLVSSQKDNFLYVSAGVVVLVCLVAELTR